MKVIKYNPVSGDISYKGYTGRIDTLGYRILDIKGTPYKAHRLIWEKMYGLAPKEHIDHINHDRSDNRLSNLREITHKENSKNAKRSKANTSGQTGVHWNKSNNRWVAEIGVDFKKVYLGSFVSFSDAVDVRKNAEVLYGFHTNHGKV